MNESIAFFREFLAVEYTTLVARFCERDMFKWIAGCKTARAFVHPEIVGLLKGTTSSGRGLTPPESYWEKGAETLAGYRERPLIAALRTEHPKLGELSSFFTGFDSVQLEPGPHLRFDVCSIEGALKVVAWSAQCSTCRTSGTYQDGHCSDCDGLGWCQYPGGEAIGALGPVLEARLLMTDLDDRGMATLNGLGASVWL